MTITTEQLARHIAELATQHHITVHYGGRRARAWRTSRHICIPFVRSSITYAIALHEIGHIVGAYPAHRIDKEVAAWEWARHNALIWRSTMQAAATRRLRSYVRWSYRHRGAHKPDADHPVWQWVR